jgi:hypothetical protein
MPSFPSPVCYKVTFDFGHAYFLDAMYAYITGPFVDIVVEPVGTEELGNIIVTGPDPPREKMPSQEDSLVGFSFERVVFGEGVRLGQERDFAPERNTVSCEVPFTVTFVESGVTVSVHDVP